MNNSGQIIATDPAAVLDAQRVTRSLRNMVNIVDASIVRAQFLVGPQCVLAPDGAENEGGSGRHGNSRFRCAHMLSAAPNIVYVMREDTIESDHPQSGVVARKNTVTHAAVVINTDAPIGDDQYSYLTITFPMVGWHSYDVTGINATNDLQWTFSQDPDGTSGNLWGDVRGGCVTDNGNQAFNTSRWESYIPGYEIDQRRDFAVSSTTNDVQAANASIFFQQYMGTIVTVRIFSAIIDGLSFDGFSKPGQSGPAGP